LEPMSLLENLAEPWELERDLKNESDIDRKTAHVAETAGKLLTVMNSGGIQQKIVRLVENPFDKDLAYHSLFSLYENMYSVAKRVVEKIGEGGSTDQVVLGGKTATQVLEEAVNRMIFQHERDELLAPVSAKLGKKKGDYGPAMYSEVVKRAGRNLISGINSQINELLPTVTKVCQNFSGVSNKFATVESRSGNERQKYEEVWLIYQAEKAARERIDEIASITKDKIGFFQDLLDDFKKIGTTYHEKIDSLAYLKEEIENTLDDLQNQGEETTDKVDLEKQLAGLDDKIDKLNKGDTKLRETERMLLTLKNLIEKFPAIESQIEFFIESDFQAKSVYKFLEEINKEMKGVFGQQNIQAFEVIAALVYKLKSTSLMYEDANYYLAAVRMVEDVTRFLERKLGEKQEKNINQKVAAELKRYGLEAGMLNIHGTMNRIKELNNRIHLALVAFGDRFADRSGSGEVSETHESAREELTDKLESYLAEVKKLSKGTIFAQYRKNLKQFQQFTEKTLEDKHIGEQVLRAFLDLSARGEKTPLKKEELLNFQKFKLYTKMLPDSRVQLFYSEALRKFMRDEPCDEIFPTNIRLRFVSEISRIEEKQQENPAVKKVSKYETALSYIAENLTPKEIEGLARFVPCMPRNELRLTYPPGKLFIDIAEKHVEFIRKQALRQYVLIKPGDERKHENEIMFKELAGRELIKKAYGTLSHQLQPAVERIKEEKGREVDFINREQNKWRKELDQVILQLQNQIDAYSSGDLMDDENLRVFSPEETALMSKYISTDQFDKIESLFGRKFEVAKDSTLADVIIFLVGVIQGFYQLIEEDELIRVAFEEEQEEKRKLHLGGKTENITLKIKEVGALGQQKKIDRLQDFWEFSINKIVPKTEQVLKDEVTQTHYADRDLIEMAKGILPEQLSRVRANLNKVKAHASEKQLPLLMARGEALLKITQFCFDILDKDEAMISPKEADCRSRLTPFSGDAAFKDEVDQILSPKSGMLQREEETGSGNGSEQKRSTEETVERNIEKLLAAFSAGAEGEPLHPDLPIVTRKNLKAYAAYISEDQVNRTAVVISGHMSDQPVNIAEKRLLIVCYHFLKKRPESVTKEVRKLIVLRYKKLQPDKS